MDDHGLKRLAAAVIERAWVDATGRGQRESASAARFLTSDSSLLSLWCSLAGVDADAIRTAFRRCADDVSQRRQSYLEQRRSRRRAA